MDSTKAKVDEVGLDAAMEAYNKELGEPRGVFARNAMALAIEAYEAAKWSRDFPNDAALNEATKALAHRPGVGGWTSAHRIAKIAVGAYATAKVEASGRSHP